MTDKYNIFHMLHVVWIRAVFVPEKNEKHELSTGYLNVNFVFTLFMLYNYEDKICRFLEILF